MRTIYKYPVAIEDEFTLDMPVGARLLTVQIQRDDPVLWAVVNSTSGMERRRFRLYGTGHQFDGDGLEYVGTFQYTSIPYQHLVFHLFAYPPGA